MYAFLPFYKNCNRSFLQYIFQRNIKNKIYHKLSLKKFLFHWLFSIVCCYIYESRAKSSAERSCKLRKMKAKNYKFSKVPNGIINSV